MLTSDFDDCRGIDGCRAGWLVATRRGVRVASLLDDDERSITAIDMPIGLPIDRPREVDRAARRLLGPRRSSVFPTPPRVCLGAPTHADASARARDAIGTGISLQSFNILGKIGELDTLVSPPSEHRWIEAHPECSFLTLNEGAPLPSKKTEAGRAMRRRLVALHFGDVPPTPSGAAVDDVLDAFAALWTAERWRAGNAIVLGDGSRDDRGLVMRIVV
jgi:predicted RNase H-like nuclease